MHATAIKSIAFPAREMVQAALSRDGKLLLYHDDAAKVHLHDLDAKKELYAFDHPAAKQNGPMRFSADKQTLYFGGQHGQLYRWDLKNNKRLPDVGRHSTWTLTSIALSPDEQILYSMGNDKLVRRWDLKTNKELPLPEGYTTQTAVVPTTDGKHLIVVDHAGHLDYWDLASGKHVKQLLKGRGPAESIASRFPPTADGSPADGHCRTFELWDLAAGKLRAVHPPRGEPRHPRRRSRQAHRGVQLGRQGPTERVAKDRDHGLGSAGRQEDLELAASRALARVRSERPVDCLRRRLS